MFGKITIIYEPPNNDSDESRVSMQFSSEADLNEIVRNFERFLRVMEYPLDHDDSLEVVHANDRLNVPPWHGDYSYINLTSDSRCDKSLRDVEN